MQVVVEKLSNIKCRLTIVVPEVKYTQAYEKQIGLLVKNAKIKGFRPGKVPVSFIRQQFGKDAHSKALSEVIQHSLYEAITEHKLRPVNAPEIDPKPIVPGSPLEYSASFEILPEIGEVKLAMDKVQKTVVNIKEEDTERVIQQLLKQYTKWQVVDRAAQEKDRAVVDYYAIYEEKSDEENKVQNFPIELGSHAMIPGFEEGLIGAKQGEERTLNLSFPAEVKDETKAGKPVEFKVTIKEVYEAELPNRDEAFVKLLGVASGKEEELKEQIQKTLNQERDRLVKEKLKEQVFQQLLEQNPMEVPQSLIDHEAKKIHDEIYQHEHEHRHSAKEVDTFKEMGAKRVSLGLLISEYAKQNKVVADKARIQQRIQEIASHYEKPQEVIAYLSEGEQYSGVEAQILEEQILDKLIEGLPIEEKEISYAELKGIRI